MKKALYITANSKTEEVSLSKTVGRRLVGSIQARFSEIQIEELLVDGTGTTEQERQEDIGKACGKIDDPVERIVSYI